MRRALCCAILFLSLGACVETASGDDPPGNSSVQYEQNAEGHSPLGLANDREVGAIHSKDEAAKHADDINPDAPWWSQLTVLADVSTVVLTAVFGIFGVLAYFLTVRLERPWLIPELTTQNIDAVNELLKAREVDMQGVYIPSLHLAVSNHGRVPGWIVERYIDLKVMGAELPTTPTYDPKNVDRTVPTPVPNDQPIQQLSRVLFLSYPHLASIRDGESTLVFYGYFKYRGLFRRWGKIRESRFCWVSKSELLNRPANMPPKRLARFDQGGPPGWTEYT